MLGFISMKDDLILGSTPLSGQAKLIQCAHIVVLINKMAIVNAKLNNKRIVHSACKRKTAVGRPTITVNPPIKMIFSVVDIGPGRYVHSLGDP